MYIRKLVFFCFVATPLFLIGACNNVWAVNFPNSEELTQQLGISQQSCQLK
jgi:hypothetical protein